MNWQNILKNLEEASKAIENKIEDAPQYVRTAWGEVKRWMEQ